MSQRQAFPRGLELRLSPLLRFVYIEGALPEPFV